MNNKHNVSHLNSLHLARKCAQIFVLGHYLFLEAHSYALRKQAGGGADQV